jgi:hypothetical protein
MIGQQIKQLAQTDQMLGATRGRQWFAGMGIPSRPKKLQPAQHVRISAQLIGAMHVGKPLAQEAQEEPNRTFIMSDGGGTQRGG